MRAKCWHIGRIRSGIGMDLVMAIPPSPPTPIAFAKVDEQQAELCSLGRDDANDQSTRCGEH